ncbi:phospholipid carrier-dependent glycosyltransferase [candidate division WWE3 bacterium]|nr:phospholipid carrier-dependent glycosyltransferase [candidate division WWE3 bacterium]
MVSFCKNFKENVSTFASQFSFYDKLFVVLFLLITFFSFYRLGRASINNDAQFWYSRTEEFISEIQDHDWGETLQNPKPGITVHWLSGLSLETFLNLYEWHYGFRPQIWTYDTFHLVHTAVIAPLILVSLGFILVYYLVVSKLFSKKLAFFSVLLFGLQPFYIGLSRNFHADSTVTAFMGISALLLLLFLSSSEVPKWKWLIFSGVFAGLALLSKSSAIFLLPYFVLALFSDFITQRRNFWFYLKAVLIWFFTCAFTFVAVFPDMWIEPLENLKIIFINEGLFLARVGRDGADASSEIFNGFFDYFEPLYRDLTLVFLVSAFLGIALYIRNFLSDIFTSFDLSSRNIKELLRSFNKVFSREKSAILILCYALFYFVQMSLVAQKMDRYLLPLIPFLAFFGGYLLVQIKKTFSNKNKKYFLLASFLLAVSTTAYYFPNYLLYPSIKGKDQFGCSLCSNVGDYLNSKDNPSDLKIVITSNKVHRLRPFVKGKIYTLNQDLPNGWTVEYLVAANHEELPPDYSHCTLETKIRFRSLPYWKIYKCK